MPDKFFELWIVRLKTSERLRKLKRLGIAAKFKPELNGSAEQVGLSCTPCDGRAEQSEGIIRSAHGIKRDRCRRPVMGVARIQSHGRREFLNCVRQGL